MLNGFAPTEPFPLAILKPADMMPLAKISNLVLRYDQILIHRVIRNTSNGARVTGFVALLLFVL